MQPNSIDVFWDVSVFLYRLKSPYDKNLVDQLKAEVPSQCRTWDAPTKTWVFEEDYLDTVLRVFKNYNQKVRRRGEVEREARVGLAQADGVPQIAAACAAFVAHLDNDVLTKAFKMQAAKSHPDKGGNAAAFTEFNSAYQFILAGRK